MEAPPTYWARLKKGHALEKYSADRRLGRHPHGSAPGLCGKEGLWANSMCQPAAQLVQGPGAPCTSNETPPTTTLSAVPASQDTSGQDSDMWDYCVGRVVFLVEGFLSFVYLGEGEGLFVLF